MVVVQGGSAMKDVIFVFGSLFVVLGFDAWVLATKTISGGEGFAMGCVTAFFVWCWVKSVDSLMG